MHALPSTVRSPSGCRIPLLGAVLAASACWLPAPAQAIGFVGYYATGNWTINAIPNASVTVSGAAPNNTITLEGKNNGGGLSNTTFTIIADPSAPLASTVSFNWSYVTRDRDGSTFDPFGYVLNGAFVQLTANGLPDNSTQSGTASFLVQPGDEFGFNQRSVDSILGRGITEVSGFSIIAVPVAPAIMGLLPLALVARKRYSAARANRSFQIRSASAPSSAAARIQAGGQATGTQHEP